LNTPNDQIDKTSQMFETARSFIAGAKIIITSDGIEEDGITKIPTLPVIMCSAIAIEIQLKTLLDALNISRPSGDGHDLKNLFDALPEELQTIILDFQVGFTDIDAQQARNLLYKYKDTFKIWRYPYEKQDLETAPAFLVDFGLALSDYLKSNFQIVRSQNGWVKSKLA
jgi:hypothetical protein